MIPLAQFLPATDDHDTAAASPMRVFAQAAAPRAAQASSGTRAFGAALPRVAAPALAPRGADMVAAPRVAAAPTRIAAVLPAQAPVARLAAPTPATVPLSALEAERRRWEAERLQLEAERDEALAQLRREADAEAGALRQDLERASEERIAELSRTLEADHRGAVAAARRGWVEEEGDRLADLVILQMAVFEDTLKTTLTALLRPLVLDARKRMAVDQLAGAVSTLAFDGHTARINATGPSDLLGALEEKLGDQARHVVFSADDERPDVRIDANQTVIETRLAAWLKAVEEALS